MQKTEAVCRAQGILSEFREIHAIGNNMQVDSGKHITPFLNSENPKPQKRAVIAGPKNRKLKPGMRWEKVVITPDSGAADTVGPESIGQGIEIQPTKASQAGVSYTVANGETMPNKGQKPLQGFTDSGQNIGITFQVTECSKLLASVRKMCEAGNRVVFDDDGSYIQNKQSGVKTQIDKHNGTYAFNMWIQVSDSGMQVDQVSDEKSVKSPEERAATFLRHL